MINFSFFGFCFKVLLNFLKIFDVFGLFQQQLWYTSIHEWMFLLIFTNYSKISHFGIKNWSHQGKNFLSALSILKALLNILMFKGLSCLTFQKFQPVECTVAYKTLLIKHNKGIALNCILKNLIVRLVARTSTTCLRWCKWYAMWVLKIGCL